MPGDLIKGAYPIGFWHKSFSSYLFTMESFYAVVPNTIAPAEKVEYLKRSAEPIRN